MAKRNAQKNLTTWKWTPHKNVFLLTCMDLRFLDDIVQFMGNYNLQNRYDHVVFAGSALGVLDGKSPLAEADERTAPEYSIACHHGTWKAVFLDHLHIAINVLKRNISDVVILEHQDCGAYHVFHPETKNNCKAEMKLHKEKAQTLAKVIQKFTKHQVELAKSKLKQKVAEIKMTSDSDQVRELAQEIGELSECKEKWKKLKVYCFIMDVNGEVHSLDSQEDLSKILCQAG